MTTAGRLTELPVIPDITGEAANIADALLSIKEIIEVWRGERGNENDRLVRVRDLVDGDFLRSLEDFEESVINTDKGVVGDNDPPDPPTDLVVVPLGWANKLSWTNPADEDLSHIEVWCSVGTQSRSAATRVAIVTAPAAEYQHIISNFTANHYYWIRAVDFSGNYSTWEPSEAQGGYIVEGGDSAQEYVTLMLQLLNGNITENQLYQDLNDRLDLIEVNATGIIENAQSIAVNAANISAHGESIAQVLVLAQANQAAIAQRVQIAQYNSDQAAMSSRVASAEQRISVAENSLGDLVGEYYVKFDINGYVSGFGLAASGETSEAIFLVDRFKIVTPGKTPKIPFSVGYVNGASTIGIDGSIVLDGSIVASRSIQAATIIGSLIQAGAITANHINVATLSAISANIGTVTAGLIKRGDDGFSFIYMNATGTQEFINIGYTKGAKIRANGGWTFGDFSLAGHAITYNPTTGVVALYGDMIVTENIVAKGITNPAYQNVQWYNRAMAAWTGSGGNPTWASTTLEHKSAGSYMTVHVDIALIAAYDLDAEERGQYATVRVRINKDGSTVWTGYQRIDAKGTSGGGASGGAEATIEMNRMTDTIWSTADQAFTVEADIVGAMSPTYPANIYVKEANINVIEYKR